MKNEDDELLEIFAADLRREFSPAALPPRLPAAIQQSLASAEHAARPSWFAAWWWSLLAPAAAALLVVLLAGFVWTVQPTLTAAAARQHRNSSTVSVTRTPLPAGLAATNAAVARNQMDFAPSSSLPRQQTIGDLDDIAPAFSTDAVVCRERRDYVDTLRWRDRRTGARLEVSYPRAEVRTAAYHPL